MTHKQLKELSNSELIELFEEAKIFDDDGDLIHLGKLENFAKGRFGRYSTREIDASVHDIYRELASRFVKDWQAQSNNL